MNPGGNCVLPSRDHTVIQLDNPSVTLIRRAIAAVDLDWLGYLEMRSRNPDASFGEYPVAATSASLWYLWAERDERVVRHGAVRHYTVHRCMIVADDCFQD